MYININTFLSIPHTPNPLTATKTRLNASTKMAIGVVIFSACDKRARAHVKLLIAMTKFHIYSILFYFI